MPGLCRTLTLFLAVHVGVCVCVYTYTFLAASKEDGARPFSIGAPLSLFIFFRAGCIHQQLESWFLRSLFQGLSAGT